MKQNVGLFLICLLAFTAVGSLSLAPIKADPGIILKVDPQEYTASHVSEEFPINITINNVEATSKLVGVEFRLSYNDTLLEVLTCTEGPFFAQFKQTPNPPYTWFTYFIEDDVSPHVLVGNLLFPNAAGSYPGPFPQGSGTIATVTFHVIYQPPKWSETPIGCPLELSQTLLVDANKNVIPHTTEDGYYQIVGLLLSVEPQHYTATYVSETFDINVTISNLVEEVHLVGVEFRLSYDATLLEVVGCVEGPFLGQWPQRPDPPYTWFAWYLEDSCTLVGNLLFPNATGGFPGPFPEGSGTIAIVTFHVIYQPPKWSETPIGCALELIKTLLVNANNKAVPHTTKDGHYYILGGPLLSVEPETYSATHVSETFDINVIISNLDERLHLVGVEFRLSYNATLLEVVGCVEGPFLAQFDQGEGTWFTYYVEENGLGPHVLVGNLLFPNAAGGYPGPFPEGSGTIATVTFHAIYQDLWWQPPVGCPLELFETFLVNADKDPIVHTTRDGSYEMQPPVVTAPIISVEPSEYHASKKSETFDINITISNLNETLHAVGLEFRLSFNATLLEVLTCTEGPFFAQFNQTPNPPYTWFKYFIEDDVSPHVLVGNLLLPPLETGVFPGPFPEGSGTIATVTFHAIYQEKGINVVDGYEKPPLTCDLTLFETLLIDNEGRYIDHYTKHGSYEIPPTNVADLNSDGKVRVDDVLMAAEAFGSELGKPRWNPNADINGDGKIRVDDIYIVARNFGWTA